jgi:predicted nucleic acid-binding protein
MFWDSSAVVPLLVVEEPSAILAPLFDGDQTPVIWWCSPVECRSALARLARERAVARERIEAAGDRLRSVRVRSREIGPTEDVRSRAMRLLAVHNLRAGDAIQLAAALTWCEEQTAGEAFVCLDKRLRHAARREGFSVLPE